MKRLSYIHKLFLIFIASAIIGFCIITNPSGLYRSYLPEDLPFVIQLNEDTPASYDAVVADALITWNDVEGSYFEFDLGLRVSNNSSAFDDVNLLYFDSNNDNFAPGTNTIAFSRTFTSTVGGYHAVESDYIYNAAGYPPATDGSSNQMDLKTITLHEIGHHQGLSHHGPAGNSNGGGSEGCGVNLPDQVMYWSVALGSLKRELFLHDEMGACALYPNFLLELTVRDASNQEPLSNAMVELSEDTYAAVVGPTEASLSGGRGLRPGEVYTTIPTPDDGYFFAAMNKGVFDYSVSKFGYESSTTYNVSFNTPSGYGNTESETRIIDLAPTARGTVSGVLEDFNTKEPIEGSVTLTWVGDENEVFEIEPDANGSFSYDVPSDAYYNVVITLSDPYDPQTFFDSVYVPAEGLDLGLEILPSNIITIYDLNVTDDVKNKYENIFNKLKIGHSVWDINDKDNAPDSNDLDIYSSPLTLFWVAGGDTTSNLTEDEINYMEKHLSNGNRLILTGSNIIENVDSNASLFRDYAGVKFASNGNQFKILGVEGDVIGDGISANLLGGGKDIMSLTASPFGDVSQVAYFGSSAANIDNIAGVRSQNSDQGWKFVFFSEAIGKILDSSLDTLISRSITYAVDPDFVNSVNIGRNEEIPNRYTLSQNYPNPFNPSTTVKFSLPVNANVKLTIFNVLGEQVDVLKDGFMTSGSYELKWDAVSSALSSGIYFYHINAEGVNGSKFTQTKKMILLK